MTVLNVAAGASIQAAIDAASSGDTIDVQAGTYTNQFLSIEKSVTLQAPQHQ
jgi:pectin methylesterase-like acyl-CoA thioesterase